MRNLKERPWRFNELQRSIDGISQKVLTDSLRQMMSDGPVSYTHLDVYKRQILNKDGHLVTKVSNPLKINMEELHRYDLILLDLSLIHISTTLQRKALPLSH